MTSLKDLWQSQRHQRQQELAERQRQVFAMLNDFQQQRQLDSAEVRERLEAFYQSLQAETQTQLIQLQQQRQKMAQQQILDLQEFRDQLQVEMAQFLSAIAADRSLMAQQLTQDLAESRHSLTLSVVALQQAIQTRLEALRTEVQELRATVPDLLEQYHQQRLETAAFQATALMQFVTALQNDVQQDLQRLAAERQQQAQILRHQLQSDRADRQVAVEDFFNELTEFRATLRHYCADIRQLVWGNSAPPTVSPAKHPPALAKNSSPKTATQPQPRGTHPKPPSSKSAALTIKSPSQTIRKPTPTPTAKPAVTPPAAAAKPVVAPAAAPAKSEETAAIADLSGVSPLPTPTPAPIDTKPALRDVAQIEKDIYVYLHQSQGARLTEIEMALEINRFQAVDALRTLIKKGLVVQHDRIYSAQP